MFHVKHQVAHTRISDSAINNANLLFENNLKQLSVYADLLLWWNKKINLVSRGVSRETILKHIHHSLLLGASEKVVNAKQVIDAGTGGGLPGIPLAICFQKKEFLLNDIVSKKAIALKQIALNLGLKNVSTNDGDIKKITVSDEDLIVSKHAFKIYELTELLKDKSWSSIVFLKGEQEVTEELRNTSIALDVRVINLDSKLKDEFYKGKAIVEINRVNNE